VIGHPAKGRIWSTVDGELRQDGDLADMIWSVPGQIAYLSTLVELKAGDLILTGTPAGVGALKPGQSCTVTVEGIGSVTTTIAG
ncbi:FAA hydrolase family protein, partial [Thioclava sp. BHET1]